MKMTKRTDFENIGSMISHCDAMLSDISAMNGDIDGFLENGTIQRSCAYSLLMMGERAKHVSDETRLAYPGIGWKTLISVGELIGHSFNMIDPRMVWDMITNDIPAIRGDLLSVKNEVESARLSQPA